MARRWRRAAGSALLAGALTAALGVTADAKPRKHRLRLPVPELGRTLSVDEFEFALRPSKIAVGAGDVRIRVYNRGEDDHNLVVVGRDGAHVLDLKPSTSGVMTVPLAPGRYKLYCALYEGTPQSHEAKGMRFDLQVQ